MKIGLKETGQLGQLLIEVIAAAGVLHLSNAPLWTFGLLGGAALLAFLGIIFGKR